MLGNRNKIIKKIIINYVIILIIVIIMLWMCIEEFKEYKIEKIETEVSKYDTQNISTQYNNNELQDKSVITDNILNNVVEEKKENNLSNDVEKQKNENINIIDYNFPTNGKILNQYKGYDVIAKLDIPIIKLQTYVLSKYTEASLNISVTKFWGANPNKVGNFCIIGHNFKNKNMFHNLRKLKIGNRLFISDDHGKMEYEVYDIYVVQPKDVSCLNQDTNGKREVTLITCTNDSQKRIIVKAKELE